jgi:nicotinamide-nucleotide adenylyltransferase
VYCIVVLLKNVYEKPNTFYASTIYWAMRALLLGRFQPFHNGHAKVVDWALRQHETLVLVIGSPEESYTFANPFTGGERFLMIHNYLKEIKCTDCALVPVPDIHRYSIYAKHVADFVPSFDVVLTNKDLIRLIFEKEGFVVASVPEFDRDSLSGTKVRHRMATGSDWQSLVPKSVAAVVQDIGGSQRVQQLFNIGD